MIVNKNNLLDMYPEFKQIQSRVIKCTVWNLDNTTTEMKFIYPPFCWNGDCSGSAVSNLTEWLLTMTRYHLQIRAYQFHSGCIYKNGSEHYSADYGKHEIPTGKLYVSGKKRGKWHSPAFVERQYSKMRVKYMVKNMNEGKNALGGKKIKPSPVKAAYEWMN